MKIDQIATSIVVVSSCLYLMAHLVYAQCTQGMNPLYTCVGIFFVAIAAIAIMTSTRKGL